MTAKPGPIVLCFGTLDDDDVIDDFIAYHRDAGVDAFVATDVGSTDNTLDVLRRYESSGLLHLTSLQDPHVAPYERDWASDMAVTARKTFGARWCLFGDADEFWVFARGDARSHFSSNPASIAIVPRYNMVPEREPAFGEANFSRFVVRVRRPMHFTYEAEALDDPQSLERLCFGYPSDILRFVMGKAAARSDVVAGVCAGFHDVVSIDPNEPRLRETSAYVLHYPARSRHQLRAKMATVSGFVARNPPGSFAHLARHWVRLSLLYERGLCDREFVRLALSEREIATFTAAGVLDRDDTVARTVARLRNVT